MTAMHEHPIQARQGCLKVPPEWGAEALAAIAKTAGATHTHRFYGRDGTEWFEWFTAAPLPPDAVLGLWETQNAQDDSQSPAKNL